MYSDKGTSTGVLYANVQSHQAFMYIGTEVSSYMQSNIHADVFVVSCLTLDHMNVS